MLGTTQIKVWILWLIFTSTRAASFKIATTENSDASAELQFAKMHK
jgi:hypothetical protein